MRKPSSGDIEAAKEYARRRVDCELGMERHLRALMVEAARAIVRLSLSYGIPANAFCFSSDKRLLSGVERVVSRLRSRIEAVMLTLALGGEDDDDDDMRGFVLRRTYGKTFGERADEYVSRFRDEVEAVVASGLVLGLGGRAIMRHISDNLGNPYGQAIVMEARRRDPLLLVRLDVRTTFGVGRTNNAFTALRNLTAYLIAEAWMKRYADKWRATLGVVGYMVMRGSSYPCETCDARVGFHTDWDSLPQYHGHCRCIAVPVRL